MASKAYSGNILDFNKKFAKNKFEDKTVRIGDAEIVFDGFINSRRGVQFNLLMNRGETVEAVLAVMKNPDEATARHFVEQIDECTPHDDTESMSELYDFILGRGTRESDPNS